MPTPNVGLLVKLTLADGVTVDAVAEAIAEQMDHVDANEAGTLLYSLAATDDPKIAWFVEFYADDAAMIEHAKSPTLMAFMGKAAGLFGGPPEMIRILPARTVGSIVGE